MHDVTNFQKYHSILCLNGDLPAASFFHALNLPVIAADGAANNLLAQGVQPQLIIGDLDSVDAALLQQHSFVHLPEQDQCDYQKALCYLQKQNLLPAIVVGINGGCLDHVLNNMSIFLESDCLLYAPPVKGFVLKEGRRSFSLPVHTKISLIGMPKACLSSTGLKWELANSLLSFPGKSSCFNRTLASEVCLKVHGGAVLVLIYDGLVADAGLTT